MLLHTEYKSLSSVFELAAVASAKYLEPQWLFWWNILAHAAFSAYLVSVVAATVLTTGIQVVGAVVL